jgi:hypothetical protein
MLRRVTLLTFCLVTTSASAQQASAPSNAKETPSAVLPMEEPAAGDHWTYEIRDEVTGKITMTREDVVMEVAPAAISVRFKKLNGGNGEQQLVTYDRSWSLVDARPWRYSPNDGTGIQSPLEIGKTWPVRTNNINSANGNVWKRSGTSKVIGQESVTTKAGTFETFKIETTFTGTNVNNPMMKNEVSSVTWYAPAIDHWVKRTFVSRANKHLQINQAYELIEYGRKQS